MMNHLSISQAKTRVYVPGQAFDANCPGRIRLPIRQTGRKPGRKWGGMDSLPGKRGSGQNRRPVRQAKVGQVRKPSFLSVSKNPSG
jgi:hypothetical protein